MSYLAKKNFEHHYISIEEKEKFLHFLKTTYNLDFSGYSEASVRRRFTKLLTDFNVKTVENLIAALEQKPDGKNEFLSRFTVNVTELFRDPAFYTSLRKKVFPKLKNLPEINIWSAGCSSGEEVLSLAIILYEEGLLHKCRIIGSDISKKVIEEAKANTYKFRNLKSAKLAYIHSGGNRDLEEYLVHDGVYSSFEKFLLRKISFEQMNLLDNLYKEKFHLILCRNVLIYFTSPLQDKVIGNFRKALIPGGYLGLGSKESILFYKKREKFQEVDIENKIYRKAK